MTLKPYTDYKDSGIEWLGQIPDGWKIDKFRHVFTESSEINGSSPVGEMLSVSGYRGVELKSYDDENQKRTNDQLENYRVVRRGQLAVNTMWLNYAGLGVSELEGHISPAYRSYWIRHDLERRYVHHLMRSSTYVDGYTALLTGIRPNSLQMSRPNLMSFPVLVPSHEEQRAIADYLDQETAEIDAFITDQEELTGLLNERRAATITRAVTKGLDPNTPMKDSGVEWLGEVPEHWAVMPLKRQLAKIDQGVSPEAYAELADDGSTGVLKAGCVNGGVFRDTEHKRLPEGFAYDDRILVTHGDLLVNRASGSPHLVGSAAIVQQLRYQLVLSDKTFRLLPKPSIEIEYLERFLNSTAYREQVHMAISGADGLANNLPLSSLRNFICPVPPLSEQAEIINYLRGELTNIDDAIADAREATALSKERRAAVISAAVTGKIDVSNAYMTERTKLQGEPVGVA